MRSCDAIHNICLIRITNAPNRTQYISGDSQHKGTHAQSDDDSFINGFVFHHKTLLRLCTVGITLNWAFYVNEIRDTEIIDASDTERK